MAQRKWRAAKVHLALLCLSNWIRMDVAPGAACNHGYHQADGDWSTQESFHDVKIPWFSQRVRCSNFPTLPRKQSSVLAYILNEVLPLRWHSSRCLILIRCKFWGLNLTLQTFMLHSECPWHTSGHLTFCSTEKTPLRQDSQPRLAGYPLALTAR